MSSIPMTTRLSESDFAAESGTTVEYRGVRRVFGSMSALDGFDLRIEPGELGHSYRPDDEEQEDGDDER